MENESYVGGVYSREGDEIAKGNGTRKKKKGEGKLGIWGIGD